MIWIISLLSKHYFIKKKYFFIFNTPFVYPPSPCINFSQHFFSSIFVFFLLVLLGFWYWWLVLGYKSFVCSILNSYAMKLYSFSAAAILLTTSGINFRGFVHNFYFFLFCALYTLPKPHFLIWTYFAFDFYFLSIFFAFFFEDIIIHTHTPRHIIFLFIFLTV